MSEKIVKTEQAQHASDNANKPKIKSKMNKKVLLKNVTLKKKSVSGESKINLLSEEISALGGKCFFFF